MADSDPTDPRQIHPYVSWQYRSTKQLVTIISWLVMAIYHTLLRLRDILFGHSNVYIVTLHDYSQDPAEHHVLGAYRTASQAQKTLSDLLNFVARDSVEVMSNPKHVYDVGLEGQVLIRRPVTLPRGLFVGIVATIQKLPVRSPELLRGLSAAATTGNATSQRDIRE